MGTNKKPRKAYRPKPVTAFTLDLAIHHAAKPAKEDRDQVQSLLVNSMKALREGRATELDWSVVAGSVTVARKIEASKIVTGLLPEIDAADAALQMIYNRATSSGRWLAPTLHHQEIKTLQELVNLHKFQLDQLGRGELLGLLDKAVTQVNNDGFVAHQVRDVAELGGMAA